MLPYLQPYAGQQVLTGPYAETYADHFIAEHLYAMPYHGVYANISEAARANPSDTKLAALEQTSFQGTTLRGLLLEAYGFWKFGEIAFIAGIRPSSSPGSCWSSPCSASSTSDGSPRRLSSRSSTSRSACSSRPDPAGCGRHTLGVGDLHHSTRRGFPGRVVFFFNQRTLHRRRT